MPTARGNIPKHANTPPPKFDVFIHPLIMVSSVQATNGSNNVVVVVVFGRRRVRLQHERLASTWSEIEMAGK